MLNIEELNLLIVFDCSSRKAAVQDILGRVPFMEDQELKALSNQLVKILESMTDEEFKEIDFTVIKEDGAYGE